MVKKLYEKNGYPDNTFTEEDYLQYVDSYKSFLDKFSRNLYNYAETELKINDRGDYSSILAAEDEEDLFRRSALLNLLSRIEEFCGYYDNR